MKATACPRCKAPVVVLEVGDTQIVLDAETHQAVVQLDDHAEVMPVFAQHVRTCSAKRTRRVG